MIGTYILIGLVSGILFAVMDGLINANPLAVGLYAVYKPIARQEINRAAGILIDLVFGFVMAGVFLLLFDSLPGDHGTLKGLTYGLFLWFFRVVMSAASQWMMFTVPIKSTLYTVAAGLVEMLVIGVLYGLTLSH
jgi:hypothetical protein